MTAKVCIVCGVEFQASKGTRKCCSPECSLERKRQIKKRWKTDNVERERECRQQRANGQPCPPVQKACVVCGRKFVLTESGGRSRKCCSAECSKKRERERQRQVYLADPGRIPRWRAANRERASETYRRRKVKPGGNGKGKGPSPRRGNVPQ